MDHLSQLLNHCFQFSYLPSSWKLVKVLTLSKPGKDPKLSQNLRSISLLFTRDKLFEKVIIKIVQRQIVEKILINASQFGFHEHHSTTLQCMKLTNNMILIFYNMSMSAVFLDIEKAFENGWNLCFLLATQIALFGQFNQAH